MSTSGTRCEADSEILPGLYVVQSFREGGNGASAKPVTFAGIYICDLPMSRVGKPPLVAAVSEAGGLGTHPNLISSAPSAHLITFRNTDSFDPTQPGGLTNRHSRNAQAYIKAFWCQYHPVANNKPTGL